MDVFYAPVDLEIEREDVASETDLDVLSGWLTSLRTIESELHTMVTSMRMVDDGPTMGMARKLGYIRIASNWVRARIEDLGGELPDTAMSSKYRRLKHHLTMANQQLEKRNKQVKDLRAEIVELKAAAKEPA